MTKYLRDLKRIAEEHGFEYEGLAGGSGSPRKSRGGAGSGHHVFIHRSTGAVVRTANTPRSESGALRSARTNFASAKTKATTKAQMFRRWLLRRYKVGLRGEKVVEIRIKDLAAAFSADHPDTPISSDHVTVMMSQDEMFERLGHDRSTGLSKVRIMGPAYGAVMVDDEDEPAKAGDECGATSYMAATGGIAVCTKPKQHEGMHLDTFRRHAWVVKVEAPAEEDEPVIDPVAAAAHRDLPKAQEQLAAAQAVEQVMPVPVSVGGLMLSNELADQLREALGVTEHAALIEDAKRALVLAQAAMTDALAALDGVEVSRRLTVGRDAGRIGKMRQDRLDRIKQAVADGDLAKRFTTEEAAKLLGVGHGQMVSTLAAAFRLNQGFVRVEANTYEVV